MGTTRPSGQKKKGHFFTAEVAVAFLCELVHCPDGWRFPLCER